MSLNYYNYFTEIEEHFQRRRGSLLLLSTLDWALIETWREAEIPIEAVIRGIDTAFDKYEVRKQRTNVRRINGLAWCTQAILEAAEELREASIGTAQQPATQHESGFEQIRITAHLDECAATIESINLAPTITQRLRELAASARNTTPNVEELERTLTVLEEKLFATLQTSATEDLLIQIKEQAALELAPYRSRMKTPQLQQVERQFTHKLLLEHYKIPRLSLFYMRQA